MLYRGFSVRFIASFLAFIFCSALHVSVTGQAGRTSRQNGPPQRPADESSRQSTPSLKRSGQREDPNQQREEVVTIDTDLTNILFTAVDKNRRFFIAIQKEDIRVLEDGVAQDIFVFQRETDCPLSLAILVDVSASQEMTLEDEKEAARGFVNAFAHHPQDEIAVVSFSGEATVEQELTNRMSNVQRALEAIEVVLPRGYVGRGIIVNSPDKTAGDEDPRLGTTAIWDAVWAVSEELLGNVQKKTRRGIILITDGVDTSSRIKNDEAVKRAIAADVAIYAIGIGDDINFEGIKKSSLRKIAERTGGQAYFPKNNSELQASFSQIEQELRSQYLVAYSPSNKNHDGSYRKVEIQLVNPEMRKQKLQLNYRQGYFAKTAPVAKGLIQ
jgi:Ca-activated chloride channel homolog